MKKIYSILVAVFISASALAQSQFIGKAVANPLGYKSTAASRTAAAAEGDTVTWYCDPTDFIPTFGGCLLYTSRCV